MKVDNIDEKILHLLIQDARTNLSELARKCGLTSSAIMRRITKMERERVIIGTELHLRKGTMGYPYQATIGINAETSSLDQNRRGDKSSTQHCCLLQVCWYV